MFQFTTINVNSSSTASTDNAAYIAALQAQLQVDNAKREQEILELQQIRLLEAQIALANDPKVKEAQATAKTVTDVDKFLDGLILKIGVALKTVIIPKKDGTERTVQPAKNFTYSSQLAKVHQILSNVHYSHPLQKGMLLAVVKLDEAVIETTLNAWGNLPYITKTGEDNVGQQADIPTLEGMLKLISTIWGCPLDLTNVRQIYFDSRWTGAESNIAKIRNEGLLTKTVREGTTVTGGSAIVTLPQD